jgi:hypothetical protein
VRGPIARSGALLLALLVVVQGLAGCAEMTEGQKGATIGTATGAVAGGVIGYVAGKGKGAAIGAAAGAVLGGLVGWQIGEYRARKVREGREAAAANNYTPQQGIVAKVDKTGVTPQTLRPGQQVLLQADYTLLAPSSPVAVREVRTLLYNGQELGRLEKDVSITPGTYSTEQPVTLPADAAEGTYLVQTVIEPIATQPATAGRASSEFRVGTPAAVASRSMAPPAAEAAIPPAPAAQTLYVKVGTANLRAGAGTNFRVVATVPRGTQLAVVSVGGRDNDRWYRVRLTDGREAWVAGSAVSTDPQ